MEDSLKQLNESRDVCAASNKVVSVQQPVERCRVWVCERGVTGHTCLNPMPCPIHTKPVKEPRR